MSIKDSILSRSNQYNYYKEETEKIKKENKELQKENKIIKEEIKNLDKYEDGISVIIPTYKGENHINLLLESLEKHKLNSNPGEGEKIFKNYLRIENTDISAEEVAKIIKEKYDL